MEEHFTFRPSTSGTEVMVAADGGIAGYLRYFSDDKLWAFSPARRELSFTVKQLYQIVYHLRKFNKLSCN